MAISGLGPRGKGGIITLPANAPATVYQWRDESGKLYMSSEKPEDDVEFRTLTVDGSLSRMDPYRPPEPAQASPTSSLDPLKVYTPSGAAQMVQDARAATEALRASQQQVQQRVDQTMAGQ